MNKPLIVKIPAWVALLVGVAGIGLPALAAGAKNNCQARLHAITGAYLDCRLRAEAAATKGRKPANTDKARSRCDKSYARQYDRAIRQGGAGCPANTPLPIRPLLNDEVNDTVREVNSLITDAPPSAKAATLILYNHCATPIKIMSPTSSTINGTVLGHYESKSWPTGSSGTLRQNAPNTFMVAPVTSDSQCQQLACQNWSDIQAAGQRMGYMWGHNPPHHNNLTWAAYCQPTNAAAHQCTTTSTTPCCGSQMVYDNTYGTTFEITPNGGSSLNQDFVDLSTNYGSGPESPPPLCNGSNPNDCVAPQANIFFNVPVQVKMTYPGKPSQTCAFPPGNTNTLTCTAVSCLDAYQYPTDNKQAVCAGGTGYVVTFCPGSHPLPAIPTATALATTGQTITIKNNLSSSSLPCAGGNTVSVFTSDGGQQVIQPGGPPITIIGNYANYPGLGLQVNNWYWTSEQLPVQVNPQNPDNSGAQFMLSDQCSLSQAPPVYGKGIETYLIANVTSQSTSSGCQITIGEKKPWTDAVTPGCCAPPLTGMTNVCKGPWGVTNNQQPWPPH